MAGTAARDGVWATTLPRSRISSKIIFPVAGEVVQVQTRTLDAILERGEPDSAAIIVPGEAMLTYAHLREAVHTAADQLARCGLGRSDRIAIVAPNSAEAILLFLAAARTGIAAPLNPSYKRDEFRFYLEDTRRGHSYPPGGGDAARQALPAGALLIEATLDQGARLVLRTDGRRSPDPRKASVPNDGDTALLLHTSGTTSRPKLVPLRQRNLSYSADNIARTYELTPDDVALCVMPLSTSMV